MNYGFPTVNKTKIATPSRKKVLFYEMNENFRWNDVKYYRINSHLRRAATGGPVGPHKLGYTADRIWAWDPETDKVEFIKNRYTGTMTPVDQREFLMVQIAAVEWKNETA